MLARVEWIARAACALLLWSAAGRAQLSPVERRLNLESFDVVWNKVRERHWDPTLGGVDWAAARAEFRPRVERARTMEEARAAMREMLGRLKQSHFGIIPAEVYADVDQPLLEGGGTGIDVRVVASQALVVSVLPGSPAARAGVKPGWVVLRAQARDLAPALDRARAQPHSAVPDLVLRNMVLAALSAPVGSEVKAAFLDGGNRTVELTMRAQPHRGHLSRFGNLPAQYVWEETRTIERGGALTGYAAFNLFLDPVNVMGAVNGLMESCLKHCDGVVIDLRGNPGGIGVMSMGLAGWFVSRPDQVLGTMYLRDNSLRFTISPRAETYAGPLAVLVDSGSASTSEIFAGGLKDLGRARIFGERTAGAALPSMFERLPNGEGFQFAVASYISEGGRPLEGIGVAPDVEAKLTREALLEGRDPALDAALEWIRSQKSAAAAAIQ